MEGSFHGKIPARSGAHAFRGVAALRGIHQAASVHEGSHLPHSAVCFELVDARGALAGALVVDATDEVLAVTSNGGVIRSRVDEVNPTSRNTMGVRYMNLVEDDVVLGIARNAESDDADDEVEGEESVESAEETSDASDAGTTS